MAVSDETIDVFDTVSRVANRHDGVGKASVRYESVARAMAGIGLRMINNSQRHEQSNPDL